MSVRDDNQAHLDALADQLEKVKAEFLAATKALRATVDDLHAQMDAGDTIDFTRIDQLAQELDDLHADT
jgi:hypothetical protein